MCIRLCVCLYNVQIHKASYGEFTKTQIVLILLYFMMCVFSKPVRNYRKYQLNSVDFTFIF